jgi:hypothetical protein
MGKRVVGPLGQIKRTHGLKPNVIKAGSRPAGGYPVAGAKTVPAHPLHPQPQTPAEYNRAARRAARRAKQG